MAATTERCWRIACAVPATPTLTTLPRKSSWWLGDVDDGGVSSDVAGGAESADPPIPQFLDRGYMADADFAQVEGLVEFTLRVDVVDGVASVGVERVDQQGTGVSQADGSPGQVWCAYRLRSMRVGSDDDITDGMINPATLPGQTVTDQPVCELRARRTDDRPLQGRTIRWLLSGAPIVSC